MINILNQFVMVGRLVCDPELQDSEDGKKVATITLAIPRSYKNSDGEYDTDFINCVLWSGIAENTTEYVKRGDLLGIKGRVQSRAIQKENSDDIIYQSEMIAEKVTFLSSKNKEN